MSRPVYTWDRLGVIHSPEAERCDAKWPVILRKREHSDAKWPVILRKRERSDARPKDRYPGRRKSGLGLPIDRPTRHGTFSRCRERSGEMSETDTIGPFIVTIDDGGLFHCAIEAIGADQQRRWLWRDARGVEHIGPPPRDERTPEDVLRLVKTWWEARQEAGNETRR